jgi:hypothetical protein
VVARRVTSRRGSLTAAVERTGLPPITDVEYADPALTANGDGWGLSVSCPWRLVRGDDLVLSWSTPDAADRVWDLIGLRVVGARTRGRDASFDLTDGSALEVFSDTDLDPWVLRLPGATYVGPLLDG